MSTIVRIPALAIKDDTTKTISAGIITIDQMYHVIAAESGTADNLDTIQLNFNALTVASITYRPFLILVADSGDTITVKHNTGNIQLASAGDVALSGNDHLVLFFDGTNWNDLLNSAVSSGVTGSGTDNRIARWNGTSAIQDSGVVIDDSDNVSGVNTVGLVDASELTIASGSVTRTKSYHKIDTEADAASDDLDTISGGTAGQVLVVRAENTARTVNVRHNGGGAGNIRTFDGNTIALDETYKALTLIYDGTNWLVTGVISSTGTPAFTSIAIMRDERSTGTDCGASSAATWNNLVLQTEAYDPDSIVAISSNQFTPIAGDYLLKASHAVWDDATSFARLRLYNVTGATAVEEGLNHDALGKGPCTLDCAFTANGTDAYRFDLYTSAAQATFGLGRAVSDGSNEAYGEYVLYKLAA